MRFNATQLMKVGALLAIFGFASGLLLIVVGSIIGGVGGGSGPGDLSMFFSGLGVSVYGGALGGILAVLGSITWLLAALWGLYRGARAGMPSKAATSIEKHQFDSNLQEELDVY